MVKIMSSIFSVFYSFSKFYTKLFPSPFSLEKRRGLHSPEKIILSLFFKKEKGTKGVSSPSPKSSPSRERIKHKTF